MKQMTEAQLRELLEELYDEGFDSGVDAVRISTFQASLEVDRMDIDARDSLIDAVMERI